MTTDFVVQIVTLLGSASYCLSPKIENKEKVSKRGEREKMSSNLTPPSVSSLMITKCESSYDRWLQVQYLPQGFKINDMHAQYSQNYSDSCRDCCGKLRFDWKVLRNFYNILLMVVWILSIIILAIYTTSFCFAHTKPQAMNSTVVVNTFSSRHLSIKCSVMGTFAIFDFVLSTIFVVVVMMYVIRLVEATPSFPWLASELFYSGFFLVAMMILTIANSVTAQQIGAVVLAFVQMAIIVIICKCETVVLIFTNLLLLVVFSSRPV